MRKLYLSSLSLLFFFFLFIVSCKKDDVVPEEVKPPVDVEMKSSSKELSSISIMKSENNSLLEEASYTYRSGFKCYVTVPMLVDLTKVFIRFNISSRAAVKINGASLNNNAGFVDLSGTKEITIVAEDGSVSPVYTIMAQRGIKEIDAMIYPFIEKYGMPAVSYAIGRNSMEDIVYQNASGFANVETKERATPDHLFRLASMSKQHTAIAIMKLIQDGKVGIDDLVFGPGGILKSLWPTVGPMSAQVTVRHLLEHTAGYSGDPMFSAADPNTLERRIQLMLNSSQVAPGTKYAYYNMGYGTLGKIIEVVTGKDYLTYLKEIYGPAGVSNIYLSANSASTRQQNEVVSYAQNNNNAYGNLVEVYKAAGGIIINSKDLFKILYAIDGGSKKADILNSSIRNLMFTKSTVSGNNYAKGWRTNHTLFKGYYHGGNLAGTATFWIYGEEYSVAVLLNSRSYDANFDSDLIVLTKNIMDKAKELNL
ncbi:serine hydrolase domain-containing protein [Sphingobacterium tabacisoli]|uniref:Serine hydrolase domain-containing protein n=1 Tax=Sphingobacterium tabacisoli TaxID=2044855 RepID=A0ABW5L1G5_9SPHI|nr:serine hydrolase domain-containing protein [Sphingobacterium tabacisoli]